jgi:glycosyltransferase involved in cell wall biosynthesis
MKNKPLVSCIIIFLNEERFLAEAVESVLEQSYTNWELLIVDDGSTDRSTQIAFEYAQKYPEKVFYLEHENHQNRGMSASRNLALRHAKGKYISYLDGDDIWLSSKLEEQLEILLSHPEAVMVYGPLLCWHSWTGKPRDQNRDYLYGLADHGVALEPDQLIEPPKLLTYFLPHKPLIPSGVFVEKEIIERVGGAEEQFRGTHEDAVVHTKICLNSKVYVSRKYWYKYRMHPDSWERKVIKSGKVAANRILFLNWVKEYFQKQQVTDPSLWEALDKAFWPYQNPRLYFIQKSLQSFLNSFEQISIALGRQLLPLRVRHWLWEKWSSYRYIKIKSEN